MNNQQYLAKLQELECRDSTCQIEQDPLVLDGAREVRIFDVEGKAYLDFCAGFGALALGHSSDATRRVLRKYLMPGQTPILHGLGDVYPARSKIELLSLLRSMLPDYLTRGMLALSGSQAVEMAAKTAMLFQKKSGFITFLSGYHGLDLGVLPFTDRQEFSQPFKKFLPEKQVIALRYGCAKSELRAAIAELEARGCGAAALIVEPVQGRGGVISPPEAWLGELREESREHNVLMILDEVFTGLGRIGSITSAFCVKADLICLGKALGGGFPLSAVFGNSDVMNAWPLNKGEAIHTGTFFGHPFSCDIAISVLETIKEQQLAERSQMLGTVAKAFLEEKLASNQIVGEVRGRGLMLGIEFTQPQMGVQLMHLLRKAGLIAIACGPSGEGISLTPPLVITRGDLFEGLEIIVKVINALAVDKSYL